MTWNNSSMLFPSLVGLPTGHFVSNTLASACLSVLSPHAFNLQQINVPMLALSPERFIRQNMSDSASQPLTTNSGVAIFFVRVFDFLATMS